MFLVPYRKIVAFIGQTFLRRIYTPCAHPAQYPGLWVTMPCDVMADMVSSCLTVPTSAEIHTVPRSHSFLTQRTLKYQLHAFALVFLASARGEQSHAVWGWRGLSVGLGPYPTTRHQPWHHHGMGQSWSWRDRLVGSREATTLHT